MKRLKSAALRSPVLILVVSLGSASGEAQGAILGDRVGHGPDPAALDRLPELRVRAAAADAWCGTERTDDDQQHELDNGPKKYHAIYAVPSDGVDRFTLVADTLQTDAFQASALLERLYGRALRFDMGTSCGPAYLDISVAHLASSTAEIQAAAGRNPATVFERVLADVHRAGFATATGFESDAQAAALTKNYVVWLDGPAPPNTCGEADYYDDPRRTQDNWNNDGGEIALVYRQGADFCSSNIVRHEIGHNLGALQSSAPSAFDGAHCDDAYEDTMCYPQAPKRASGEFNAEFFDYGNNDYWDPPGGPTLPRWTVNLSSFVCPTADCNLSGRPIPTSPIDSDRDSVPDAADRCPSTRGTRCAASSDRARAARSVARAHMRRHRVARGRWRVRVRVRGHGRARVRVVCRHHTVRRRTVHVPARLKFRRVHCRGRRHIHVRTRALRPHKAR